MHTLAFFNPTLPDFIAHNIVTNDTKRDKDKDRWVP
jgi:hypothetical protein